MDHAVSCQSFWCCLVLVSVVMEARMRLLTSKRFQEKKNRLDGRLAFVCFVVKKLLLREPSFEFQDQPQRHCPSTPLGMTVVRKAIGPCCRKGFFAALRMTKTKALSLDFDKAGLGITRHGLT